MSFLLPDVLSQIASCDSFLSLEKVLKLSLQNYKFKKFAYTLYTKETLRGEPVVYDYVSPDLDAWHRYFHEQDFEGLDEVGRKVKQSLSPIVWDLESELSRATGREKQVYQDAILYGLSSGISIPVHAPNNILAILVVHYPCITEHAVNLAILKNDLQLMAIYVTEKILALSVLRQKRTERNVLLTMRELQCLQITLAGSTAAEVAAMLGISVRTANFHFSNINRKLGVKNKYKAAQKALKMSLIDESPFEI